MVIPDFDANGILSPGIFLTSLDEFEKRFVYGLKRKVLFQGLLKLMSDLKSVGCTTIYVDGSFVTDKVRPGDIDVCWDERGLDLHKIHAVLPVLFDFSSSRRAQQLKYGCDIFPAYWTESGSSIYFIDFFQRDKKTGCIKGIIELKL